ncbi:protein of unknown function [Xenorhabdus nematophila AN6/1]|nr:protein of unknown function [Xenorhabdus nematophila AN6/1]
MRNNASGNDNDLKLSEHTASAPEGLVSAMYKRSLYEKLNNSTC